jgi:hypothetical protein
VRPNGLRGVVLVIVAKAVAMIYTFLSYSVCARVCLNVSVCDFDITNLLGKKESVYQRKLLLL